MTTKDEIILGMHQHINPEALLEAKRNGNLISYLTGVADKIFNTPGRIDPIRNEEAVYRLGNETFRVSETRSNPSGVRPPTPQPRRSLFPDETVEGRDNVRISRL